MMSDTMMSMAVIILMIAMFGGIGVLAYAYNEAARLQRRHSRRRYAGGTVVWGVLRRHPI